MSRIRGNARQSQLVTTFGVGALFPSASESLMIAGLGSWGDKGRVIEEPRLARALGVSEFRAPVVEGAGTVPVIRFPDTQHCTKCHRIGKLRIFCGTYEYFCRDCKREPLVPSRFVVCCTSGHIDDFPYYRWLHSGEERVEGEHNMKLKSRGRSSSLADIEITCDCGVKPISMEGSFDKNALKKITKCTGRRPWLDGAINEQCDQVPRTLQRGSSNVWFPVTESAISIPPWSEALGRFLQKNWHIYKDHNDEDLPIVLKTESARGGFDLETLVEAIRQRKGLSVATVGAEQSDTELRVEEYKALQTGRIEDGPRNDFVCTAESVPHRFDQLIVRVSKVSRLREVRALRGFTRVAPFVTGGDVPIAPLSLQPSDWLPAIEVLGEGIFIDFDPAAVSQWEASTFAVERTRAVQAALDAASQGRGLSHHPVISARKLMLHAFAHGLIDQLSLDAGYPGSSLRERLYADEDMAGVLIYTASSDSAGSLGGLAAMSAEDRLDDSIAAMLARMSWCSSDPVCIESGNSGSDGLNLAACHSCLLLPETSCELNNTFLDRAMLIGTPDRPNAGFFAAGA